jgi:hypothetical protein
MTGGIPIFADEDDIHRGIVASLGPSESTVTHGCENQNKPPGSQSGDHPMIVPGRPGRRWETLPR